jgi:hypothetical protein
MMPRKNLPRPDPTKQIPPLYEVVSEELIRRLSALIGKPFPRAEIGNLDTLVRRYHIEKHLVDNRASYTEIVAALRIIGNTAKKLSETLGQLDPMTAGELYMSAMSAGDGATAYQRLDRLQHDSAKTAEWVDKALTRLAESGRNSAGRRKEIARRNVISGLCQVFEEASGRRATRPYFNQGKGKYSGPFLRFVACVMRVIVSEHVTEDQLANTIREVIESRQRQS